MSFITTILTKIAKSLAVDVLAQLGLFLKHRLSNFFKKGKVNKQVRDIKAILDDIYKLEDEAALEPNTERVKDLYAQLKVLENELRKTSRVLGSR